MKKSYVGNGLDTLEEVDDSCEKSKSISEASSQGESSISYESKSRKSDGKICSEDDDAPFERDYESGKYVLDQEEEDKDESRNNSIE